MADISSKNVAVLVHNYFEQAEFEQPIAALKQDGASVTVISASGLDLLGLNHVDKGDSFQADIWLDDARADDFDALVIPGGAVNSDHLRMVSKARTWVVEFLEAGKPLAAICHAPWVLVSAGIANGRSLTSYHTIQDDIRNAGGDWVDEEVVVHGNLLTSRQPDDLPAFNKALVHMLSI